MKIIEPVLKVLRFSAEDVIATSFYIIPADEWNAHNPGNQVSSDYAGITGDMTYYNEDAKGWYVQPSVVYDVSESEVADIRNPDNYSYLRPITYDAYYYDGSENFYTKGASYYEIYNQ